MTEWVLDIAGVELDSRTLTVPELDRIADLCGAQWQHIDPALTGHLVALVAVLVDRHVSADAAPGVVAQIPRSWITVRAAT
jgi:hypothetical protein